MKHSIDCIRDLEPNLEEIRSQACTQLQFEEPLYSFWVSEFKENFAYHRKQWEWVFIARALSVNGFLEKGVRGLGFGVGIEPLPPVFAKYGCDVLVTEWDIGEHGGRSWSSHYNPNSLLATMNRNDIFRPDGLICEEEAYRCRVSYQDVDMNNIPENLKDFDFVWSSCSLDHLGTRENCNNFIYNSVKCLSRGGIAVHTTEYNLMPEIFTPDTGSVILFNESQLFEIASNLMDMDCEVRFNLNTGNGYMDLVPDRSPWNLKQHVKLAFDEPSPGVVVTSIGLIIKKL